MATTSTGVLRRSLCRTLAAFAVALPVFVTAATVSVTAASASATVAQTQADVRTDIVSATRWQLGTPRPYKVGGKVHQSVPNVSGRYNYLGRNGSNENRNIYNRYNGDAWCGHFARWAWTKGGAVKAPVPHNYARSQAWRTEVGNRWRPYSSILPKPGDVLVWSNKGDSTQGHVAVVTAVNTSKRAITYIGGNEWIAGNRDSIVQHSDYWSNMDISMSGKTFRGFASRF